MLPWGLIFLKHTRVLTKYTILLDSKQHCSLIYTCHKQTSNYFPCYLIKKLTKQSKNMHINQQSVCVQQTYFTEHQGRHMVFWTHRMPSLFWTNVIRISQFKLLKIVSNDFSIGPLSRMIAQPPGLNMRSISTTMVAAFLHLQQILMF